MTRNTSILNNSVIHDICPSMTLIEGRGGSVGGSALGDAGAGAEGGMFS